MSQFPEEPLNAPASEGFGYFPAFPGLKLDQNRYEVVRKLGFGPRSSVWLVTDTERSCYTALKILTVHATQQQNHELKILQTIQRKDLDDLPTIQCHFTTNSAHGAHLCVGLAVLGASVEDLRLTSPTKTLPVHIVQKAIGSVMGALLSLHGLSITHGAVTADNIRFFAGQSKEDLDRTLAQLPPCTIEKNTVDGVEYPIVRSHPIPHGYTWNEQKNMFSQSSIYLSNVGHAQMVNNGEASWSGVDASLRPPEVIIETSFDTKVDVWMIGCATYHLLTGEPLVHQEKTEDEGDQLAWMQAMVKDRFKREIALSSPVRDCFFAADGRFVEEIPEDTLESRFAAGAIPNRTDNQTREAIRFIERCLALDPADRPTISELRHDPWLQPGYACSCGYCG